MQEPTIHFIHHTFHEVSIKHTCLRKHQCESEENQAQKLNPQKSMTKLSKNEKEDTKKREKNRFFFLRKK